MPRIAVIGVGDYYRKIQPGIAKWFEVVATIDRGDYGDEPGALSDLVASSRADAVMVLTPNRTHAPIILELARLRIPVFVEKPLVTTLDDMERVRDSLAINPALYCSDFSVDITGVPLLRWLGKTYTTAMEPWVGTYEQNPIRWGEGFDRLGRITEVRARLLEGTGAKSSFKGREWLWDDVHGGVLWDLAYHHLTLWFAIFDESLTVESVRTRCAGEAAGEQLAETYAEVELRSSTGIRLRLEVGKYTDTDDSSFEIIGTAGTAKLGFASPRPLSIDGKPGAYFEGSFAEQTGEAFRAYVDSGPSAPYGFELASQACGVIVEIRSRR